MPPNTATHSDDAASSSTVATSTTSSETHTCPYTDCHKSFSKKYNLKAHLRLHTGEQPFECDRPDCRKKFKWRSSLSSHSVWHTRKDSTASPAPASKSSPAPASGPTARATQAHANTPAPTLRISKKHTRTRAPPSLPPRHTLPKLQPVLLQAAQAPATPPQVANPLHHMQQPQQQPQLHSQQGVKAEAVVPTAGTPMMMYNGMNKRKRPRGDARCAGARAGSSNKLFPSGAELKEMANKEAEGLKLRRRKGIRQAKRRKTAASGAADAADAAAEAAAAAAAACEASTYMGGMGMGGMGMSMSMGVDMGMGMGMGMSMVMDSEADAAAVTEQQRKVEGGGETYAAADGVSPGSPVTTDSGMSEDSLDLDLEMFACGVLPGLIGADGETTGHGLGLGDGGVDVAGMLGADADVGMFGYASPSCGALNGLDTRFGPFELDNLQSFGLSKVEGL